MIHRNIALFVVAVVAFMGMMATIADASDECISWQWRQTGSHTECSGWFCWTVPEYSFVCTEYAPDPEPIITPQTPLVDKTIKEKPTSLGFAYTFGNNDTERYQTQKSIGDMRAIYIMENIAWSHGLYPDEFEKKYKIR